ncbi:prolyl-tRNA synthetase, partial [Candidatus Saccharibacteria bacterium]|nr:prolyl-tRNA synthetase [Candidatus Saccharibacteria bacterium]
GEKQAAILHDKAPEQIIFDDRASARTGEKFADADLMGIPYRVVISDKTLADQKVEVKNRKTGETKLLTLDEFTSKLA